MRTRRLIKIARFVIVHYRYYHCRRLCRNRVITTRHRSGYVTTQDARTGDTAIVLQLLFFKITGPSDPSTDPKRVPEHWPGNDTWTRNLFGARDSRI